MNKKKIINDPVYGFVSIPHELVYDLMEHPYFQRLRRIQQVGLTHYVYPGALHTRFHHALGAMHLMTKAIHTLRNKGVAITDDEALGVTIAILLHDIGHGPFSHALEHTIIDVHHETLSLRFIELLNQTFDGQLATALQIFQGIYPKKFLHQLVSSQLDMDRLDYLNRDSFFTGVSEGVIGYDRIIQMLNVVDDEVVVEQKGIHSIEKFLIARRIMYWQVYLHKASLSAERMLINALHRMKYLAKHDSQRLPVCPPLQYFLHDYEPTHVENQPAEVLRQFAQLDDYDIIAALKSLTDHPDFVMRLLTDRLLYRKLFRIVLNDEPFTPQYVETLRQKAILKYNTTPQAVAYLVTTGEEVNRTYQQGSDEIKILLKNGTVQPFSQVTTFPLETGSSRKYFVCYPKEL